MHLTPFSTAYRTALVIDDDHDILEIASMGLEQHGTWRALTADSGPMGIDMAILQQPDVILLDVVMCAMDGLSTLAALRAEPRTARIPVVLLTAKVTMAEGDGVPIIYKPFDPMGLPEAVEAALARRLALQEN
jgi:CheY-like chemotaxis protein